MSTAVSLAFRSQRLRWPNDPKPNESSGLLPFALRAIHMISEAHALKGNDLGKSGINFN
jgi:hypothetical protein